MLTQLIKMEESTNAEIQEEANDLIINVNENSEVQRKANNPSGNESQNGEVHSKDSMLDRRLANNMTEMLESLEPPLSPKCCIYRVPHDLRKLKEEAYTPRAFSIGPFHHGDKRMETTEKLKVRCFKRFVQKAVLNVENLVSIIRGREGDVRHCYAETIQLNSDDCVQMILLDASFIIVFFLIHQLEQWRTDNDLIAVTPRLMNIAIKDMRLLENQLHFFVIEVLYNFALASCSNFPSFTQLAIGFFARSNLRNISPDPDLEIKHFVDMLRTSFLPQSISQRLPPRNRGIKVMHLYTASQLYEAGVKFKVASSKCLFDLKFTNGVLEIPRFKIYNYTESLFRNLMALEQCHYPFDAYFTDYIHVLDFLIDNAKDVDLLVRKGILVNGLGESNAVTTLVNNLRNHIFISDTNSDYCGLCEDLNSFYEDPWHNRKATLRHDYFNNPWRTTATIVAIILLVLTFTQTVCSIISLSYI